MQNLVEMRNVTKKFPGVVALKDVNFDIRPGEVHVLLGENGAGKSTLMKILSGAYTPTSGEVIIGGETYDKLTPALSSKLGISIIYQELSVINQLSIQENIFLGKLEEKSVLGIPVVNKAEMLKKTKEYINDIGLDYAPETPVSALRISEKQMVEIAKAVAFNANVIIMDEPTSSLTDEEVNNLFDIIKKLKEEGKGIVYISHKLKEIMQIGDRVSVLKDGAYVGTHDIKDVTIDDLVTMMVGRELENKYQVQKADHQHGGEVVLEVKNLTRKDEYIKDINFVVKKGEILGFSGLVASGRSETMEAIYGAVPIKSGEIILNGKTLKINNTYEALKEGIALVTENRRETGFFHNFSIKENISVAKRLKKAKMSGMWGLIDNKDDVRVAKEQIDAMNVKCASMDQLIVELSGGNQQKVILGKWMASGCKLIIFDEPTKGIDVGTKAEIYKLMRALCDEGIGVIVVSSEMPELLAVCDRILVYYEGKINGEYDIEDATEEKLAYSATVVAE
ncbi:MAG: ATP-binding cassette domain-containing protein [Christensenellaceae bacterium]|nr:ATP-binding cassette domain-containing protein [Christensenellaceae bacterium]